MKVKHYRKGKKMMKSAAVFLIYMNFCLSFDKNLHSLRADFIQYQANQEQQKIYYSGSFMALSPHFAKWEYKQPFEKIVYLSDETLISYEPVLQQAIIAKISQKLNFLKIIQNAKQDSDNKDLFVSEIEGQSYRLLIQNDLPERLEYEDTLGNLIVIEFKNVLLNPKISQQVFIFSPPNGVDMIKQ